MHDDRTVVEGRIQREVWQRVLPHLYRERRPMAVEAWHVPGEPVDVDVALAAPYTPFAVGGAWGPPWGTTWFRLHADVPAAWAGASLEAVVDLGFRTSRGWDGAGFQAEGLVWLDGEPRQGVHPRRTGVPLPDVPAGPLTLHVEAAANPSFPGFRASPLGSLDTAGEEPLYRLAAADLAVRDDEVYALLLDIEVLDDLMRSLPVDDPRRARLRRTLAAALDALDVDHVGATAAAARAVLAPALALPARAGATRAIAVGHAHIDTAWLWPLRETVRKCTRTFASAVRLLDERPDHRFVCSQAVQWSWMAERHPSLFERMRDHAHAGRFVPVGGMWVEADMNLPSGESIVRQLVHGQRWFEEHLGVRCTEVWIPDVFGYPATLPQIFAAAGCRRFVTQKLSWNKQNRFPHHTFAWEGLDGTRVLTHFPPVDTYNAEMTPSQLRHAERNFRDAGWSDWTLVPFGYGNGGGGPTREMVDRAARMTDLDGVPPVRIGTPTELFDAIEAEVDAGAPLPVWRGELYFEMHRGTLTSQVRTKLGNRRCERLLREAELWWAAPGHDPARVAEVARELDGLWKEVLLQQFHDILPGSSIAWVHADAEAAHARVAGRLEELVGEALGALVGGALAVANAGSRSRHEVLVVAADDVPPATGDGASAMTVAGSHGGAPSTRPLTHRATGSGGPQRSTADHTAVAATVSEGDNAPAGAQRLADGRVALPVHVPGFGVTPLTTASLDDRVVTTEHTMANSSVCVQWSLDGTITSIIDVRHGRELLPAGSVVALELAPDHPVEYDAWDLEAWTAARGRTVDTDATVELVDAGPLVATLRVARPLGSASSVVQTVTVRAGSARVDIGLDVDWHEDERLLSLRIPLDVRADTAACDVQFGHVHRPTHPSSPWDAAKFEVCAHRFVDLSEPGFGVAVLNDGRYGHGLFDGGVRVSLLRAAKYPDPTADHGRHAVTVSILPHGAGLLDVLDEAEALNVPLRLAGRRAVETAGHGSTRSDATPADRDHVGRATASGEPGSEPAGSVPARGATSGLPAPVVALRVVDAGATDDVLAGRDRRTGVDVAAVKLADDGSGDLVVRVVERCGDRRPVTVSLPERIAAAWRCDVLETPTSSIDVTDGIVALVLHPWELVTLRLSR